MAELVVTALAMVNAPAAEVHTALVDYQGTRPHLLTDEFGGYQVLAGGQGLGTEVRWTLALDEAIRNKKGKRPKPQRRPLRDCVIQVSECTPERVVERDTQSAMVIDWTLRSSAETRTAVRVDVTWERPSGRFATQRELLALRTIYEGLLTNLHEHFEQEPATEPPADGPTDPGPTDAE